MEKKQIIATATSRLNQLVNLNQSLPDATQLFKISRHSGNVSLEYCASALASSDPATTYPVFIQSWAPQKDINTLISQLKALPDNVILLADFVNPVMAEKFRHRSINFVDCAGNINLKANGFDYFVKGQRAVNLRRKHVRGRAFNTAGLKLIFALFNQPGFLNASYREISNKVNIALGSVGPVMDDLYASGYILDDVERKLVNKKRLFERWVDGYLEKLRPRQIMACYRSDKKDWWKKADPHAFAGFWGGEVLVARDTPYMIPESITLYFQSDKKQQQFAEANGLIEDEDGEICVYRPFWSPRFVDTENDTGISPLIVYADIVDSINPGAWDVAKTFYGEAVAHLLKD